MRDHMNVALNFHKGDQMSAKLLLELLLVADEGIDCTYYLQYGDPTSTIEIQDTLTKFLSQKNAHFSNELPNITVPQEMISNDPNVLKYEGNHTIRSTTFKMRMFEWNLCVFKYIHLLDSFLMIEPDCCILKQNWLHEIYEDYRNYSGPIFGHLKRGKIRGKYVPTHWAGCSIYNSEELRKLPLEKYFYERYENPWWRYRNEKDTETANNCFLGPAFSGYDITYDYFLFGLYWREKTGINDPFRWPTNDIEDKRHLILCDFKTKLSADEIFNKFADKLPLMHGIKDDEIRHRMIKYFSRQESVVRSLMLSGPEDSPVPKSNNVSLNIRDLKNRFSGQRCFIIGNGPSLRDTDMRILKNEYTIGANRIYLNYENMGFEPTFYCSVNSNVLEQFAEEIDCVNSIKFVRSESRKYLKNTWNTFFMGSMPSIGFNEDLESLSWHEGWTVTFCAMQVAFYLGFDTVILIGVDHFFKKAGEPNKLVTAKGDDPNHFHPSYFGKDVKWQYPDLKRSEQSYRIAKEVFEKHGRRILDATVGGKLQVFPKVDYLSLFDKQEKGSGSGVSSVESKSPIVSIIMPAFNAATFIGKAVESVQTQSFTEWELIVIDDGSTDNTREIVQHLITRDPRIQLIGSAGKGVSDARNTGLDAARGKSITFLDADDFMYPDALERRADALKKNPTWNLVHCITEIVGANSKKLRWQLGHPEEVSFKDMSRNPCHLNSLLGRAQVFRSVRFQSGLIHGEDFLFLSDVLRTGEVSHRVDNCSVAYVVRREATAWGHYLPHENKVLEVLDIIYSPVRNNLPAAPEFAQGLSSPPKEAVILRRRIGLLTWLLLEQRANDVAAVLSEFSDRDLSALSRSEIGNQIIYPAMRFYVCRQEELFERLHKDKAPILRLISQTGIEKTFPQYAREFKLLMKKASKNALKSMPVSDNSVGPFKRNAHAHIDENTLVATLLADQTRTGVMIDVGAMHGSTLSPFYQAGWRVFAFEPDPTNREELETRFGYNPNLTIDGRAVADRIVEHIPFYSSAESPGISSLHPFHESHKETCTVSTTTIADFVREKDLHHIDYLKIDVEGYDLLVLKGVPWDSIKPNVIMCEFEDRKTRSLGYTMHDMARYLTEHGYKVMVSEWHPVIRYGIKHDWHRLVPYPCDLHNQNAWGNLIAIRDQLDLQEIASIARRIVKVDAESTSLRDRTLYQRLVNYLNVHYPAIITTGRFVKWGLATLKNTFLGVGGIALLVTVGLYIAGALVEPLRWYLVGIASALLLLGGGLLALSYARLWLNRYTSEQRQSMSERTQLQTALDELNKTLADLKKDISDNRDTLAKMNKEISDSKDTLAKMNVGNFPLFQQFNRRLSSEDLKHFAVEWAPKLGLNLDARAMAYMAHRICLAEDTCVGRLAGNIETMLLRVLVARSVKEPSLELLEIGTLFGIGVAVIHENCRGFFNNLRMTVIDPLNGFYGTNQMDIMTKIPVTRDMFVHNMQRMNIPKSDYTIIEKLSTEDEAIELASKRRYNLLIIDGDHSEFGVKHDFYNYRHLVKRGGYIVFDDYNNPNWPDVKDFVDKEVAKMPELEFVGTDFYTAVFRVITT